VALVDCSAFYCSCERVFRPDLDGRPVVVLSNNDGCVIARTSEAKALGVAMGTPYFKTERELRAKGVAVFSSNYALYADMSARVVAALESLTDEVERYSIDEAFVLVPRVREADLWEIARETRRRVAAWTSIPVRVSIAPTKTLAKVASELARSRADQTYVMTEPSKAELSAVAVGDVWGIGPAYRRKLEARGVMTAWDLAAVDASWARRTMTVVGERTVRELRGQACIGIEREPPSPRGICRSRSFGRRVTTLREVEESVMTRLGEAAAKLRRHGLTCGHLSVFVSTGRHAEKRYSRSVGAGLGEQTSDTMTLARVAGGLLRAIWRPGFDYKKAGVMVTDLASASAPQAMLFQEPDPKRAALMAAVDVCNERFGRGAVRMASAGLGSGQAWQMQRRFLSPAYTTDARSLPVAKVFAP
jgi:DNA polymerase V